MKKLIPTIFFILDITTDILYIQNNDFHSKTLRNLCISFIFFPLIGIFIFFLYLHLKDDFSLNFGYFKIINRSLFLAFIIELNIGHFFSQIWKIDDNDNDFDFNANEMNEIINLECTLHQIFHCIPQFLLQIINNFLCNSWNFFGILSPIFSLIYILELLFSFLRFLIKKFSNSNFQNQRSYLMNSVELDFN